MTERLTALLGQVEIGNNLLTFGLAVVALVNTYMIAKSRHDQKPNRGSTSRDALDRIEAHTLVTAQTVAPELEHPTPPAGLAVTAKDPAGNGQ